MRWCIHDYPFLLVSLGCPPISLLAILPLFFLQTNPLIEHKLLIYSKIMTIEVGAFASLFWVFMSFLLFLCLSNFCIWTCFATFYIARLPYSTFAFELNHIQYIMFCLHKIALLSWYWVYTCFKHYLTFLRYNPFIGTRVVPMKLSNLHRCHFHQRDHDSKCSI